MKNTKGLTLMELIVVLAIIVIIGAIAVPVFLLTTDRARLRADIQSARVIQQARELYILERNPAADHTVRDGDADDIVAHLIAAEFLNEQSRAPQTGLDWIVRSDDIFWIYVPHGHPLREFYDDLAPSP